MGVQLQCSRARRVIENAFGIVAHLHRWRCPLTTLQTTPHNSRTMDNAAPAWHNLMRIRYPVLHAYEVDQEEEHGNVIHGAWWEGLQMANPKIVGGSRITRECKHLENYLAEYNSGTIGRFLWLDNLIKLGARVVLFLETDLTRCFAIYLVSL